MRRDIARKLTILAIAMTLPAVLRPPRPVYAATPVAAKQVEKIQFMICGQR